MLFDSLLIGPAKELYDKLCSRDFNAIGLRKELDTGKYAADDVNAAVINYIDDCTSSNPRYEDGHMDRYQPGLTVQGYESSHLTDAIELLLDYGLDPNKIYLEETNGYVEEYNIMQWLQFVYNGYQGADSLYLLLNHGGDPNLIVNRLPLISDPDFDVCFDTVNRKDLADSVYDAKIHFWMVLVGFGATTINGKLPIETVNGFDIRQLRNHRDFYFGVIYSDRTKEGWDLCIFDRHTNWEVARL